MKLSGLRFVVVLLVTGFLAFSATGCAAWNRVQTTQVTVQVSGDRLLHIAAVPRILPNGERPTEQLAALLEEMGQKAGGYTLIENVMGGWVPPHQKEAVQERNDLLLVAGPPAIAYYIKVRLHNDFKQEEPFVISVPLQSIAFLSPPGAAEATGSRSAASPAGPKASEEKEPAGAKAAP